MSNTKRDTIAIDLDGPIDRAIAELRRLKKCHPGGKLRLTSEIEYGESYARLLLDFTREKLPVEIEIEEWQTKRNRLGDMEVASAAFAAEGLPYPRAAELAALREELGAFANPIGSLTIYGDTVAVHTFDGLQRRDGSWIMRTMGSLHIENCRWMSGPDSGAVGIPTTEASE